MLKFGNPANSSPKLFLQYQLGHNLKMYDVTVFKKVRITDWVSRF